MSINNYLLNFKQLLQTWFDDLQPSTQPVNPEKSDFLQSVNRIRWIHVKVARDIVATQRITGNNHIVNDSNYEDVKVNDVVWTAFHQDLTASNIPAEQREPIPPILFEGNDSIPFFNQHSLAFFQFNAFAYPIIMGERFGIKATDQDLWAFNHLSAVIGYTFGLDDKFNLALQPEFESLKEYYWKFFNRTILPSLFKINKRTKVTIENILEV